MKRIILIILSVLLSSTVAMAAPFLVCDPQTGVTHYKLTGPAWVTSPMTAQADGSIRMDVATALVGNNALTVAACRNDVIWGGAMLGFCPFRLYTTSITYYSIQHKAYTIRREWWKGK